MSLPTEVRINHWNRICHSAAFRQCLLVWQRWFLRRVPKNALPAGNDISVQHPIQVSGSSGEYRSDYQMNESDSLNRGIRGTHGGDISVVSQ
jgi:hypothetical protein